MTASGTRLVAYIAVPRERIDALVGAADRLLSLELNATPLRYRRARVMSIHLTTEPEPDWQSIASLPGCFPDRVSCES